MLTYVYTDIAIYLSVGSEICTLCLKAKIFETSRFNSILILKDSINGSFYEWSIFTPHVYLYCKDNMDMY